MSIGDESTNYGFTGEWADGTGLVHLRARYYAPGQGRFVSRDVWEGDLNRPLSLNAWNYVEGNPPNNTDPSGYYSIRKIKKILGVSTYDQALEMFRIGTLAGKMGFLYILHEAKDYDTLKIYELTGCIIPMLGQDYPYPVIEAYTPFVQIIPNGMLWATSKEIVGYLKYLEGFGLLHVDNRNVGRNILQYASTANAFVLVNRYGGEIKTMSSTEHNGFYLIPDRVDWPEFWSSTPDVLPFLSKIFFKNETTLLTIVLEYGDKAWDFIQLADALAPVYLSQARGEDPDQDDVENLQRAIREYTLEESLANLTDGDIPGFSIGKILTNLRHAIYWGP